MSFLSYYQSAEKDEVHYPQAVKLRLHQYELLIFTALAFFSSKNFESGLFLTGGAERWNCAVGVFLPV